MPLSLHIQFFNLLCILKQLRSLKITCCGKEKLTHLMLLLDLLKMVKIILSKMDVASPVAQMVKNPPAMWENWVEKILWRRKWQPTPVFLPSEFHGQRSLSGYNLWGCEESDMTEQLSLNHSFRVYVDSLNEWKRIMFPQESLILYCHVVHCGSH